MSTKSLRQRMAQLLSEDHGELARKVLVLQRAAEQAIESPMSGETVRGILGKALEATK